MLCLFSPNLFPEQPDHVSIVIHPKVTEGVDVKTGAADLFRLQTVDFAGLVL